MSDGVSSDEPRRILFVFAWLVVGGEETEIRLLAQNLDSRRYRLEVVACFRKPNMPEQTHEQLAELGVSVDRAPYDLSFDGGCDAFMPVYVDELENLTRELELENAIQFLGDRADVPRLLAGLDVFVWLSRGEGMPQSSPKQARLACQL